MHQLEDMFQVWLPTAKVCFTDNCLALSPGATSHLPQHSRTNVLSAHFDTVQDDSASRPVNLSAIMASQYRLDLAH